MLDQSKHRNPASKGEPLRYSNQQPRHRLATEFQNPLFHLRCNANPMTLLAPHLPASQPDHKPL